MTVITLTVPRTPDARTLQRLARELEATTVQVQEDPPTNALTPHERARLAARRKPLTPAEREAALKVVAAGGDGLSIADPVAWQREIREDRTLPFHD